MAKKKRSASVEPDPQEEEDEEMGDNPDEAMSEEEQDERQNHDGEIPFLDTFYGLASADSAERAQSAHTMLQHCLLGPSANSKDAAYALRRLLNGLCSGRAAARQGYASALTSFLKIAYATGALQEVQAEANGSDTQQQDESLFSFVRNQLLKTTDPTRAQSGKFGKVKGSEERDYQFGRLFGILSIVRSGILIPSSDDDIALDNTKNVFLGLVNDLIELHHHKKWMREPTAHGIITLLNSLYDAEPSDDAKVVLDHLVRKAIVPKLFAEKGLDSFTAEQVAVAVSIQSHNDRFSAELPPPLNEAVVSSATIPTLLDALSATSSVVHPRMHVVWDVLWLYLTDETIEKGRIRSLSDSCAISNEPAGAVVKALMQSLVVDSLLSQGDGSNPTHERRALALTIVRAACGGQVRLSTSGPFVIATDLDLLQNVVLSEHIVRRLFLDVICAGTSSKGSHMLKPLALHVLGDIVDSEAMSDLSSIESLDRRLAIVKVLLVSDPRFDGRTKTTTMSNLLLLEDSGEFVYTEELGQMWERYVDMLEDLILRTSTNVGSDAGMEDGGDGVSQSSAHEATGYVDLLFNVAKRILRLPVDSIENASSLEDLKSDIARRVLGFFMACAFFDCSQLAVETTKPTKKKKRGRKQSFDTGEGHPAVKAGLRVKNCASQGDGTASTLPYDVRIVASARFFSLLADFSSVATSIEPGAGSTGSNKQRKDARVLRVLADTTQGWTRLEDCGAQSLAIVEEEDKTSDTESIQSAKRIVKLMQLEANGLLLSEDYSGNDVSVSKARCTVGSTILASTLSLQLLRCGSSDEFVDEIDEDDGDDDEDIAEMITDLQRIPGRLVGTDDGESPEDDGSSPLLGLTELCIHVLSSPIGTGRSRGASPKLLREAVKFAWIGGLGAFAAADEKAALDDDILGALLSAVGATSSEEMENGDEGGDSDERESDSDESDKGYAVFSQAAGAALGLDDDSSDAEMKDENADASMEEEEEEDVELDPAQLESILLEDSDAFLDDEGGIEVGELEHHAGADAALARLIKLKQDTRKAGREALERLQVAKQLRCVLLIDTLLSNPGRRWNDLLQTTVLMKTVDPLLKLRRQLEKSLEKVAADQFVKKSTGVDNEKRALLDRLTTLLKSKVCKVRWSRGTQPASGDVADLATELMNQVRRSSSTDHASCCSSSLLAVLRHVTNVDDLIRASSDVYGDAVTEWSTKRTTKIQTSLFDDLAQQMPSLAQVALVSPLVSATKDARSPYLKTESFRLLGTLFSRTTGDNDPSELDRRGHDSLEIHSSDVVRCIAGALRDEEMLKTKRVRDVLKVAEKAVIFLKGGSESSALKELAEMKDLVHHVKDASESSGITSICERLERDVDDCIAQLEEKSTTSGNKTSTKSSKKKKKKGKKKR